MEPILGLEVIGAARFGAGAGQEAPHGFRAPAPAAEGLARFRRRRRRLNQRNDLIDVREGDGLPFQNMAPLPRFAKQVNGSAGDDLPAMAEEGLKHFLQVEDLRLPIHEGHAVDPEDRLQLGLGVEVVQHHFPGLPPAQLNDHPKAVLVRFVPELADPLDALFLHQLGDLLDEPRLVQHVGQLGDEDRFPIRLLIHEHFRPSAHIDATAAGFIGLHDACAAIDDARRGEVRARDDVHEIVDGQAVVVDERDAGVDHFRQIVGRDVRRHAHGNAGGAVHQEMGHPGRQHGGHVERFVIVSDEIHRFLVEIREERLGHLRHAHFRVAHGRRGIAVHGTEVALPVHQQVTHGEILGHAHDGVVHRGIPVGVVFTDNLPYHPRRFHIGAVVGVVQFAHGEQHPTVHRLQPVADIGQGPTDDDTHGVVEVGLAQLVLDIDG